MSRVVILKFEGDLHTQGFYVTLEIRSSENLIEEWGQLCPNPKLADLLQDWQEKYRSIGAPARIKLKRCCDRIIRTKSKRTAKVFLRNNLEHNIGIGFRIKPKRIIYNGSIRQRREECKQAAKELRDSFLSWIESDSFRPIDKQLREELQRDEEVRLLLRSTDHSLQKLPWHEWDFVQRYPNAEVVLTSLRQNRRQLLSSSHLAPKNRILAILGHSEGINVEADRALLESLTNSEVTFLVEPQRQQVSDRLWEQSWDIIFFAGHSETEGETGRIYLNPTDSLTIEELWYALRKAVDRGLKLAIFNSCDGLGLVQRLDDLEIPHLIVMRELVPDRVAQEFLKYLLFALAEDKPVHLAVREARERLQTLEQEFPCATWLPVIHQNVDYIPVSPLLPPPLPIPLKQVLLISFMVTLLVMGIRWTGFLQAPELQAYDHLMRSRPMEQPDPRLLLVSIDEEDIRQYKYPIPDNTLATTIEKLQQEKPIAIGINITRDMPVEKEYARFVNLLQQNQQLITTCGFENPFSQDKFSINPPPNAPSEQVGFNNVITDWQWNNQDNTIRRQLLSRTENPVSSFSKCDTEYSFSFLLAMDYLKSKELITRVNVHQEWELGKVVLKSLSSDSGSYQNLDARGYQVLINYRNTPQIAQSISLNDVLNGKYHPTWVENKVILIGVTASSVDPGEETPLGKLPKLHVQAQMLSSILSASEGDRPQISWLPIWVDVLWVSCWSLVGVGLVLYWRSRILWLWSASAIAWGILYGLCWAFLIGGIWLPLIPAAIALFITEATTAYWIARPKTKETSLVQ